MKNGPRKKLNVHDQCCTESGVTLIPPIFFKRIENNPFNKQFSQTTKKNGQVEKKILHFKVFWGNIDQNKVYEKSTLLITL